LFPGCELPDRPLLLPPPLLPPLGCVPGAATGDGPAGTVAVVTTGAVTGAPGAGACEAGSLELVPSIDGRPPGLPHAGLPPRRSAASWLATGGAVGRCVPDVAVVVVAGVGGVVVAAAGLGAGESWA
jgi:hypothetical protein